MTFDRGSRIVVVVFSEISQNSQGNTCARVSLLIKLKKILWHRLFPVNFAKFLRIPFFKEHLQWLLLFWQGPKHSSEKAREENETKYEEETGKDKELHDA